MMKKLIYILLFLSLFPANALATEFAVEVDTGRESINALEGKINVPSWLSIENIYFGDSAILIWIEEPLFDEKSKIISFSGITPGGFSGERTIFIFQGHFDQADINGFSFSGTRALKNDGSGTAVPVTFSINKTTISRDQESPDEFKINLASSPEIFEGRKFITFLTQDNGTGVSHYEYASTWLLSPSEKSWVEARSPMVLENKALFQRIHIRAVDKAFNSKVSTISGPYWYVTLVSGVIILLCVLLYIRRLFSSSASHSS